MITLKPCDAVLSDFNPMVGLKPTIIQQVNNIFFTPIAKEYFKEKEGGLDSFEALDTKKLKTEIDFNKELDFVNKYIYPEITTNISKNDAGIVHFKPKYVFTFDKDLTPNEDHSLKYPYASIFKYQEDYKNVNLNFWDGKMCLGSQPILYYIWIDLQMLIRFIKNLTSDL